MNEGQKRFREFALGKVQPDKEAELEELMAESFRTGRSGRLERRLWVWPWPCGQTRESKPQYVKNTSGNPCQRNVKVNNGIDRLLRSLMRMPLQPA